jgi:hypothetical protein
MLKAAPKFVLGSEESATYPQEGAGLDRLVDGLVKYRYVCGCSSSAALLGKVRVPARLGRAGVVDHCFEHPEEEMVLA